jgi:hypothetical protein
MLAVHSERKQMIGNLVACAGEKQTRRLNDLRLERYEAEAIELIFNSTDNFRE